MLTKAGSTDESSDATRNWLGVPSLGPAPSGVLTLLYSSCREATLSSIQAFILVPILKTNTTTAHQEW